jgi:hypothetical protein
VRFKLVFVDGVPHRSAMKYLVLAGSALAFLFPSILEAQSATPPPGQWSMTYADNFCLLARERVGDNPGLVFRTRPYSQLHDLVVLLPKRGQRPYAEVGQIMFGSQDRSSDQIIRVSEPRNSPDRQAETFLSSDEIVSAVREGRLSLLVHNRLSVNVPVNLPRTTAAALAKCEADLAGRWNAPRHWATDPKPLSEPRFAIKADDLRDTPMVGGVRSGGRPLLTVSATGIPSDCRMVESSGSVALDNAICAKSKIRLRFVPARDSRGKPVASYFLAPRYGTE